MSTRKLTLQSTVRLSTGYSMPVLGLGVYKNDDPTEACAAAFRAGYRHVDSAKMYGNEAQVGRALRASGIPRSEVFITSKAFNKFHGYETTLAAVDESLAALGMPPDGSYYDLYLIHDPKSGKQKRLETWKALVECRKAGKLRSIGVSNYGPRHLDEIVDAGLELPSVNQVELHPFCQQKEIVEWCKKHGVLVQAYCPVIRMVPDKVEHPTVVKIAKKHSKKPTQVLIRWSLQKGYVPLPKSTHEDRIIENADLFDFELEEGDMGELDSLDQGAAGAIAWNPVNAE